MQHFRFVPKTDLDAEGGKGPFDDIRSATHFHTITIVYGSSCQRTPQRRGFNCSRSMQGPTGARSTASNRKIRMTGSDDWKKTVRRNKLLGMWAAEKLGMTGQDAEAYSDALAVGTLDPECSDVFSKIRKDFDVAGVVQSDEQILRVMNEFTLQAGKQMPATRRGGPDVLAVMLARKLKS